MKKFLSILIMFCLSAVLFAQSDVVLDKLYENEKADTLITSLLVLQAAGQLTFEASTDDAASYLESQSWGPAILKDEEYISMGSFSLLVMESFNLPHGIMYNFLPIKRYALKEMLFMGYILGNPYPSDTMSSFDVVYVLSSIPVSDDINKNYDYDNEPEEEVDSELSSEAVSDDVTPEVEVPTEEADVVAEEAEVLIEEAEVVTEEAEVVTEEAEVAAEDVTPEAEVVTEEAEVAAEEVTPEAEVVTEEAEVVTEEADVATEEVTPEAEVTTEEAEPANQ